MVIGDKWLRFSKFWKHMYTKQDLRNPLQVFILQYLIWFSGNAFWRVYHENHKRYHKTDNSNGFLEYCLVCTHVQSFKYISQLWAHTLCCYLGNRGRYRKTDNTIEFVAYCLVGLHVQKFENLNQLRAIEVSRYLGIRGRLRETDFTTSFFPSNHAQWYIFYEISHGCHLGVIISP